MANRIIVVLLVESIYDTKVIVCSCPLGRYWQAKKFAISADGSKTRVIKQEFPPRFMERPPTRPACKRSEEHTSELQSLMRISYAVFCLKKKKHIRTLKTTTYTKKITSTKTEERRSKHNKYI